VCLLFHNCVCELPQPAHRSVERIPDLVITGRSDRSSK
jgi:hypothetical protein